MARIPKPPSAETVRTSSSVGRPWFRAVTRPGLQHQLGHQAYGLDLPGAEDQSLARRVLPALRAIRNPVAGTAQRHGVHELVVLHAPEGALARTRNGQMTWAPSLELPEGFIAGSAGAGDAFFAGVLAGLHEGWPLDRTLALAHGSAAASLRHPTCTQGVVSAQEIDALRRRLSDDL